MRIILVLAMLLGLQANAATFQIDKSHSAVEFKIRHFFGKVTGKFKDFDGEFEFDAKKPNASKGLMTIKVESIDTNDPKRDDHLRSADFFDAGKFENITFQSKSFKKSGNGYKLTGDMTMRGITKSVTFDVDYLGTIEKDPFGKTRSTFTARSHINRKDFGIVWNKTTDESFMDKAKKKADKTMLGDDVELNLNIEAVVK